MVVCYFFIRKIYKIVFLFQDNHSTLGIEKFFDAPYSVTTSYLARAVVNNVLQGFAFLTVPESDQKAYDHCRVF